MRISRTILPALALAVAASACATARMPLTDVPAGNYVLVEPEPEEYNAVAVNEWAFTVRDGDEILSGKHWLDADGQIHMAMDTGPCAGVESVWTYEYSGNRVTLNKVSDACAERDLPDRMVYERR